MAFFGIGLFIGLPTGCYLKERGFHNRIFKAVDLLQVNKGETQEPRQDQYLQTNATNKSAKGFERFYIAEKAERADKPDVKKPT